MLITITHRINTLNRIASESVKYCFLRPTDRISQYSLRVVNSMTMESMAAFTAGIRALV